MSQDWPGPLSGAAGASPAERAALFAAVIEALQDAVVTVSGDGRVSGLNAAAERLYSMRSRDVVGKAFSMLLRQDHQERGDRLLEGLRDGEASVGEEFVLTDDAGGRTHVVMDVCPLPFTTGAPSGGFVLARDVTAQRQTQELFLAAVESSPSGILMVDELGQIRLANAEAERMFGYERGGLQGEPADILVPSRLRGAHEMLRRGYMRDPGVRSMDQRPDLFGLRRDGTEFPAQIGLRPAVTQDGPHALVVVTDVSVRVAAEPQRMLQVQEAENRKMEALGRLAGGIGHDFNNLLTVIMGSLEPLSAAVGPEGLPLIDEVHQAATAAADLTRQLLEAGRQAVIQPRLLDLGALIQNMAPSLRRLAGERVQVQVRSAPGVSILADPTQIARVVQNLVTNARDAMPAGGSIDVEVNAIGDVYQPTGLGGDGASGYARLRVTDTGWGFDEATKARIFEPFFTTKREGYGAGMGLASVLGAVTQANGRVYVESEVGVGSVFSVYFPLAGKDSQTLESDVRPNFPPLGAGVQRGQETVLLVDDEVHVLNIVRAGLTLAGYQVIAADNGQSALNLLDLRGSDIDLVVTDVVMPRVGGDEVAERARALRPDMPVLYISGYADDETVRNRIAAAGAPFLQKPFTMPQLTAAMRQVLSGAPRRQVGAAC